jgi:hypothetical protein
MLIAAARRAGSATGFRFGCFAPFLRETLRSALAEKHVEMFARRFDLAHRILRDDTTVVFYFHFELVVRQDSGAELKDFREAVRAQPVVEIATDVRLKDDRFVLPGKAAAVDKVFHDMTNFSDVGMRGNDIPIGQDKARKRAGMLFEDFSESCEFHGRSVFLLRNIVKAIIARESREWTRM